MKKLLLPVVTLSFTIFLNNSFSYSEEVITINNDKLYSKDKIKKKVDNTTENKIISKQSKYKANGLFAYTFAQAFSKPLETTGLALYTYDNSPKENTINKLPYNIGSLVNLKNLIMSSNKLSDLSGIGNLPNLEELNLQSNKINIIPDEIGNLIKLKNLNIEVV